MSSIFQYFILSWIIIRDKNEKETEQKEIKYMNFILLLSGLIMLESVILIYFVYTKQNKL